MTAFGVTDIGKRRETNQDNYKIHTTGEYCSAVVCDGMGGANGGNIASKLAADAYTRAVRSGMSRLKRKSSVTREDLEHVMLGAVSRANTEVYDKAFTDAEYEGMGTTLVALLTCGGHIVVVNVGDSRAYCLKKNVLVQATKDHSFVQFLIDNGTISPAQAENHPNKNLILRALGVNESIEADTYFIEDCAAVLLCSDGLTNCVSDENIRSILRRKATGEEKLRRLIDAANNGGGADNITAVLYLPD